MKIIHVVLIMIMAACGGVGGGTEDTTTDTAPSAYFTPDSASTRFRASGPVTFRLTCGDGDYDFRLHRSDIGLFRFLGSGSGAADFTVSADLAENDYWLESTAATWTATVTAGDGGTVVSYLQPGCFDADEDCNCQGCCSAHGGVVCCDGVTQCADGTALSDDCVTKGCVSGACPGCLTGGI